MNQPVFWWSFSATMSGTGSTESGSPLPRRLDAPSTPLACNRLMKYTNSQTTETHCVVPSSHQTPTTPMFFNLELLPDAFDYHCSFDFGFILSKKQCQGLWAWLQWSLWWRGHTPPSCIFHDVEAAEGHTWQELHAELHHMEKEVKNHFKKSTFIIISSAEGWRRLQVPWQFHLPHPQLPFSSATSCLFLGKVLHCASNQILRNQVSGWKSCDLDFLWRLLQGRWRYRVQSTPFARWWGWKPFGHWFDK